MIMLLNLLHILQYTNLSNRLLWWHPCAVVAIPNNLTALINTMQVAVPTPELSPNTVLVGLPFLFNNSWLWHIQNHIHYYKAYSTLKQSMLRSITWLGDSFKLTRLPNFDKGIIVRMKSWQKALQVTLS